MGIFEPELITALNTLLEGERASAEMEVALASGATEYMEREALTTMGGEDIELCCALREQLDRLDIPVSRRVHGAVYSVMNEVRYDDRLRAFAAHQRAVADHAESLLSAELDRPLRDILISVRDSHVRHILWCERRAEEFAATRLSDFGGSGGRMVPRRMSEAATMESMGGASAPQAASSETSADAPPDGSEAAEPARPAREVARDSRAIPHYPYVPGVGATQITEDEEAGKPLPDTTLE